MLFLLDVDGVRFVAVANPDTEPHEVLFEQEWGVWGSVPRDLAGLLSDWHAAATNAPAGPVEESARARG